MNFTADTTERLDKFLASKIVDVSRSKIQKAIKDGKVLVNQNIVSEPDQHLEIGDSVEVPEFAPEELKPSDLDLKVVFENDDVAVIDKPPGLVVHPGAGNTEDTLANILISKYPSIRSVGDPHRPGIVHRLDEDTSGLILIAKTPQAFDYFKDLFMERKVEKEYLALGHGIPAKRHDLIDLPIQRVPLKQKMKIGLGKPAQTEYWALKTGEIPGLDQTTLFRVKLHTGRTHQIRLHLSHIGHPIIGDALYGRKEDAKILGRQFLHAYRLKFQLPGGSWIELFSQLPEDLTEILKKANIQYANPII
jgi:23S rRNA pseudouridine1911/1915/1917 synthase